MNFGQLLSHFFHDDKVVAALALVVVDLVLGVGAAVKLKTFRLSYFGDFGRNDILYKLLPYYVLYSAALLAGHETIVIPGLDLGVIAGSAYVVFMAQWVGSILNSLKELGIPVPLPQYLAGSENDAPPKD
jgi:hypothetical protein